jgi:hypothetical protein
MNAPGGTAQLYDKAAQFLGSDVLFNANVVRVDRGGNDGIRVYVETPTGPRCIQCKKLVIAFPPTPDNLGPIDLDSFEERTLSRFRANYYATALVQLSGLQPGLTVQNIGANTTYNLPPLPGIYSLAPTAAPGLWNVKFGSASWLPDLVVQAKIIADIERMKFVGTFPTVAFDKFVAFSSHAPFELMVSPEEIAAGFYTDLNSLQGRNKTYYTSAAFQTNDSSLIWEFTEGLLPQVAS